MVSSFDELFIEVKKAGSLKRLIVNDKIKYLKLAGPINGTDFNTIRKLKKLTYLDLSNCQFVGGGRSYEINDYSEKIKCVAKANELSDFLLVHMENSEKYEQVFLPSGIIRIGKFALAGHNTLKSIEIPDTVEVIDDSAFSCCCGLIDITFGTNLKRIGDYAFWRMHSLSHLLIPSNVEEIGVSSLCSTKLEVIKILNPQPPQIKKVVIEPNILAGFKKLKRTKRDLMKLSPFCTVNCKVIVPKNSLSKYKRAPGWRNFTNIVSE